jgi:hypothetical protein
MSKSEDGNKGPPEVKAAYDGSAAVRVSRFSPLIQKVEDLFQDAVWNRQPRYLYIYLQDNDELLAVSRGTAFEQRVMQGHANKAHAEVRKTGLPPVLIMSLDTHKPFDEQINASHFFNPKTLKSWDIFRDHPLSTIFDEPKMLAHDKPAGHLPWPDNTSDWKGTLELIKGTWVTRVINNGFIERTPKAGSPWQIRPQVE